MPDPDPNEFVYIKHKDVATPGGPVSRQAFEEYWKPVKGWSLASASDVQDIDQARLARDPGAGTAVAPTTTNPKGS